jgi:hypothetical protein
MPEKQIFLPSIAPWLSVRRSAEAIEFYQAAFGATQGYRLDAELSFRGLQSEFGFSDIPGNWDPQLNESTNRFRPPATE